MMHRIRAAIVATGVLAGAATAAQAATLVRRTTNVFGNFTVGYASLGDGGSFNEFLSSLELAYSQAANDAGAVSGDFRGTPVEGSASFASEAGYVFDVDQVAGQGGTSTSGDTPYDHVSLGANALSLVRLEFTVDVLTPFVLTGSLSSTLGPGVGARTSEALATVVFSGCVGCSWRSDITPGAFVGAGTLIPGNTYRLQGNTSTRLNGDAQFAFDLQLSPVPEPAAWLLLTLGLPALLWRRHHPRGEHA
jgi:hypothetical protein